MQILVFVLMLFALMSQVDFRPDAKREALSDQVGTAATQMAWYHNAATTITTNAIASATGCTPGLVSVPPGALPPGMSVASAYVSATDCTTKVVTTWVQGTAILSRPPMSLGGAVAQALHQQSSDANFAGAWNASTQSVNGSQATGFAGTDASIPAGFEGLPLTDGIPVVLTNLY